MSHYEFLGGLVTLVGGFSYINARFFKFPDAIGTALLGMLASLGLMVFSLFNPHSLSVASEFVSQLDFSKLVMDCLLGLLLFAGALGVDLSKLKNQKWAILTLATVGVVFAVGLIGLGLHMLLGWFGIQLSLLWCMVFGALIAPTDTVAVLGVVRKVGAPQEVEGVIVGEALFNDGVAVVLFVTLVGLAMGGESLSLSAVGVELAQAVLGGLAFGGVLGLAVIYLMRSVHNSTVDIFLTLALATGGYTLAHALHLSGPLAVVAMGLVIGKKLKGEEIHRKSLESFWEILDEVVNLLLFALIGLQALTLNLSWDYLPVGLAVAALGLSARYISVGVPLTMFKSLRTEHPNLAKLLTWGGLRGGISIALALSLPSFPGKDLLLGLTYIAVAFSLVIQATTLQRVVNRLCLKAN